MYDINSVDLDTVNPESLVIRKHYIDDILKQVLDISYNHNNCNVGNTSRDIAQMDQKFQELTANGRNLFQTKPVLHALSKDEIFDLSFNMNVLYGGANIDASIPTGITASGRRVRATPHQEYINPDEVTSPDDDDSTDNMRLAQ